MTWHVKIGCLDYNLQISHTSTPDYSLKISSIVGACWSNVAIYWPWVKIQNSSFQRSHPPKSISNCLVSSSHLFDMRKIIQFFLASFTWNKETRFPILIADILNWFMQDNTASRIIRISSQCSSTLVMTWSEKIMVAPRSFSWKMTCLSNSVLTGSNPLKGSSKIIRSGSWIRVTMSWIFCWFPLTDSWFYLSAFLSLPTSSSIEEFFFDFFGIHAF